MASVPNVGYGALVISLIAAPVLLTYDHPLSPQAIREAYFLGRRNDEKTGRFLAQYVKRPPLPKSGPHVAVIEVRTPYQQVVQRARQATNGYSAQQAAQDSRAQADLILVRVQIHLTPTYSAQLAGSSRVKGGVRLRPDDFWRDFTIRLAQEQLITPEWISGRPIYDLGGGHRYRRPAWGGGQTQV